MEVKLAASELIQMFGPNLIYAGQHKGHDVYRFAFPENQETGFPYVFVYKDGGEVTEITGHKAIELLKSLHVK